MMSVSFVFEWYSLDLCSYCLVSESSCSISWQVWSVLVYYGITVAVRDISIASVDPWFVVGSCQGVVDSCGCHRLIDLGYLNNRDVGALQGCSCLALRNSFAHLTII